jgi:hypothetical protein
VLKKCKSGIMTGRWLGLGIGAKKKVNCRNSWPLTIACHMKNLDKSGSKKGNHHPALFCFSICSLSETKINRLPIVFYTTKRVFYYVKTTLKVMKPFAMADFNKYFA